MEEQVVVIPNRAGLRMMGNLIVPDGAGPFPGVLILHGFRGNRQERHIVAVAESLAQAGCISLRVDLTHNVGEGEGDFRKLTVSGETEDALAAIDFLAAHPLVDAPRIGLAGHSLGGMVAVLAAARTPSLAALAPLSAVFSMSQRLESLFGQEALQRWREQGELEMDPPGSGLYLDYGFYEDLLRYDMAQEASRVKAPTRLVQGDADKSVPREDGERYLLHLGTVDKELSIVPRADHTYTDPTALMMVCLYTADWFRRRLRPAEMPLP